MIEGSETGPIPADRRGFDGPAERAGEAEVACRLALTIGRKPTDMPEDSGDGIVRRTRAEAGFLGHAFARDAGPGPGSQQGSVRFHACGPCRWRNRPRQWGRAPNRGRAAPGRRVRTSRSDPHEPALTSPERCAGLAGTAHELLLDAYWIVP